MWIKNDMGNFVNLSTATLIKILEPNDANRSAVWAFFSKNVPLYVEDCEEKMPLFFGKYEQCQAYMAELEKELAAFGKLIRVVLE